MFAELGIVFPPGPAAVETAIAHGASIVVAGDPPVAFAAVIALDGHPHLEQISVRADQTRSGIGSLLLDNVVRRYGPGLTLLTFRDVPWNGPWYLRHGFAELPRSAWGPRAAPPLASRDRRGTARPRPPARDALPGHIAARSARASKRECAASRRSQARWRPARPRDEECCEVRPSRLAPTASQVDETAIQGVGGESPRPRAGRDARHEPSASVDAVVRGSTGVGSDQVRPPDNAPGLRRLLRWSRVRISGGSAGGLL